MASNVVDIGKARHIGKGIRVPVIDTDIGPQRLCRGCRQSGEPDPYWPVDEEFWYFINGRPAGRCKACVSERGWVNGKKGLLPPLVLV